MDAGVEHVKLAREDGGMVIEVDDPTSSEPALLLPKVSDVLPQPKENVNVQVRRRPCSSRLLPAACQSWRVRADPMIAASCQT